MQTHETASNSRRYDSTLRCARLCPARGGWIWSPCYGSYGSYGSSGGYGSGGYYAAGYGSSGYASYGSSGSAYAASYGSSGGYGSSGAAYGSSGGYGSSGVAHVGPVRRLAARIHAHHAAKVAARASYGSSGASYGSSGSSYVASYGSSGGYGSSGSVSYGSSGSYVAPSYGSSGGGSSGSYAAPSYAPAYSETIISETPMASSYKPALDTVAIANDTALLTVAVDEQAIVTVNGLPTKSAGPIRQFMSNGLKDGFVYSYEVKVSYPGSDAADSKIIKLRAGSAERLVFSKPASEEKTVQKAVAPETVVTLHVPEDAKVVLAGNETEGEGEVRTFRTRQLAEGQNWSDYTIRVTATVRGTSVTKVKSIDLKAGDHRDLVFDFDTESVASR